jgi:hypothetical protein
LPLLVLCSLCAWSSFIQTDVPEQGQRLHAAAKELSMIVEAVAAKDFRLAQVGLGSLCLVLNFSSLFASIAVLSVVSKPLY